MISAMSLKDRSSGPSSGTSSTPLQLWSSSTRAARAAVSLVVTVGSLRSPSMGEKNMPCLAIECCVDDRGIAVGALDDVDAFAGVSWQSGRIAGDHPERFSAVEQVVEDLVADEAGRGGDDDHWIDLLLNRFCGSRRDRWF